MRYKCPHCASESLRVDCVVTCEVVQSTNDVLVHCVEQEVSFTSNSNMECSYCGHSGPAKSFRDKRL